MKIHDVFAKKEHSQIFRLFSENSKLKFVEIERALGLRSNMVAYHLECMQRDGFIEKKGIHYCLTKFAERQIPIFSRGIKEQSPLPIILVAVVRGRKILLLKRTKRPYKNYWGLIGGKLRFEETIFEAVERLVKEKTKGVCKSISLNSILHERVREFGAIKHSFILLFAKVSLDETSVASTQFGVLKFFSLSELKNEVVIPSDLWLVKNKLSSRMKIPVLDLFECDDKLTGCRFVNL